MAPLVCLASDQGRRPEEIPLLCRTTEAVELPAVSKMQRPRLRKSAGMVGVPAVMTDSCAHTPGPWRAFISNGVIAVVTGRRRSHKGPKEVIKWTGFEGSDFPQHAIANSFLIAASPRMLLVLTEVETVMSTVEPRSDKAEYLAALDHVRRVIAEARGEGASTSK